MSRSHKKRKIFQVDSMLGSKMHTEENSAYNWINGHLTMIFLCFYHKNLFQPIDSKYSLVKVETTLLKKSHKKRKDSTSALMKATVGHSDVPLNPKDNDADKVPAISVPKESFKPLGGPLQLSFILLFRIQNYPSIANGIDEGRLALPQSFP
jgi:polycomb protein SUZ12